MKRCPKCNRTFPDENQRFCTVDGGLLIGAATIDTSATIRSSAAELGIQTAEAPREGGTTSRELSDPNATIASSVAPTVTFPRGTGTTNKSTSSDLSSQVAYVPTAPPIAASTATAKKGSKLPWILGGLLLLLLLGGGGAAGFFFLVIQPQLQQSRERSLARRPEPTPVAEPNKNPSEANVNKPAEEAKTPADTFVPPANAIEFRNTKANLDGKLADHYIDFSFYYPNSWQSDPKAGVSGASNFVKVERMLPPDFTQENFAVGWYTSKGTFAADLPTYPQRVEELSSSAAKIFPGYRKVSEGPTKVNSMDAYEFRYVGLSKGTEKGDLQLWGRVVFLPTGVSGKSAGATLTMLATSLAPELSDVGDVGDKGEMPVILESFRFGENR